MERKSESKNVNLNMTNNTGACVVADSMFTVHGIRAKVFALRVMKKIGLISQLHSITLIVHTALET